MARLTYTASCPRCGSTTRWREVRHNTLRPTGKPGPMRVVRHQLFVIPCRTCGTCPTFDLLNLEALDILGVA